MSTLLSEVTEVESVEDIIEAILKGISPIRGKIGLAEIRGEAVSIMEIGKPSIELLTLESTSREMIPSKAASGVIADAITELLENGTDFYTVLRHGWNMPAIHWQKAN